MPFTVDGSILYKEIVYLPHPLNPPLLVKERGIDIKRGANDPLRHSVSLTFFEGEEGSLSCGRIREGRSPSLTYIPPSLNKITREGGQGDRFPRGLFLAVFINMLL